MGYRLSDNKLKTKVVSYSLISTILINAFLSYFKKHEDTNSYPPVFQYVDDFSLNDIKNIIYSSKYLNDEEKKYLYNEEFFEDILQFINENFRSKVRYLEHLSNIIINNYGEDDHGKDFLGYYTSEYPNAMFVRNYVELDGREDTLSHEFMHLMQCNTYYNLITEACAEILSYEYFEGTRNDVYNDQVRLLRKIMEIIGTNPILVYNFTGDFSQIEDAIKPYLSENEYQVFLDCLSFEHGKTEYNRSKFESLDELIGNIYKNKYNDDIENNEIMNVLNNSFVILSRYYFNKRLMDKEHSYYIDRGQKEFTKMSYDEAIATRVFLPYTIKYTPISYDEAMELIASKECSVARELDYQRNTIIIIREIFKENSTYITAIIDGIKYENESIDDLYKKGIINVEYKRCDTKILSADEYLNHRYPSDLTLYEIYSHSDFTLYKDYIEGYVPKKIYMEPVHFEGYSRMLEKSENHY